MPFIFYHAAKTQKKIQWKTCSTFSSQFWVQGTRHCTSPHIQQKLHSPLCSRESYFPEQLAKAFFCTLPRHNLGSRDTQASSLQFNIILQQASKPSPHTLASWPCNKTWYNIRKLHKPATDHWCLWRKKSFLHTCPKGPSELCKIYIKKSLGFIINSLPQKLFWKKS